MPVTYHKIESLALAIVVDEEALGRLAAVLKEESLGDLWYVVELTDGGRVNCDTLEEILSLPNVARRRIKSISVFAQPTQFHVAFDSESFAGRTVRYSVEGDEKTVYHLSRRIEEYAASLKQWYSGISRLGWGSWLVILWGLVVLVVGFLIIGHRATVKSEPTVTTQVGWLLTILLPIGFTALAELLSRLTAYLFPPVIFAIGGGITRYKSLVFLRQGVLGAFALTILAGLIISLITHH